MEAIAGLAALAFLLWVCSSSGKKGSEYKRGDLKIARDSTGEWYVYEVSTGREIYRDPSKRACADYLKELTG